MSGDPEQEYFSDGIAEDIITELSRMPLAVRHRPQLQLHLQGPRVDVKQVGARTRRALHCGRQRAARRQTGSHRPRSSSMRNRQPRLGRTVRPRSGRYLRRAGRNHPLRSYRRHRHRAVAMPNSSAPCARPPESLSAWEAYQRALSHWSRVRRSHGRTLSFFDRAVALDPRFAPAHAMLALHHILEIALGGRDFAESALSEAELEARTAIELDRDERHSTFLVGLGSDAP